MKIGCTRRRVAPATLNCCSSRSAGRSQGRRSRRASARGPLTASWRGGYQRCIRTFDLTIKPADLTACQSKFHLLHITRLCLPGQRGCFRSCYLLSWWRATATS